MSKILNPAYVDLLAQMRGKIEVAFAGCASAAGPITSPVAGSSTNSAEPYVSKYTADEIQDRVREFVHAPVSDLKALCEQFLAADVMVDPAPAAPVTPSAGLPVVEPSTAPAEPAPMPAEPLPS